MEKLGDRLKEARELKGYTQQQVSDMFGLSSQALSNYERNLRDPDSSLIVQLADLYGVTTDWLLGRDVIQVAADTPPWMDKLTPATRERLVAVGGLRNFHTRFLGGKGLNDLGQHDLEIIMQVYFRHLEESERKRKLKEHKSNNSE